MGLREIRKMDEKEYEAYFSKYLRNFSDTLIESLSIEYGHTAMGHENLTDDALMQRCVEKRKNVSQFISYEEYGEPLSVNEMINETLYMKIHDISRWICDSRDKRPMEISEDFGTTVGYGYEKKTHLKKDTSQIRIILHKASEYDSQLGFFITTAYPEIENQNSRYIGQLSRDPYKDGSVVYNTLDDVTEIMTKEQYLESIKEKDDISQVKEQLADFQSIIIHNFAQEYGLDEHKLEFSNDNDFIKDNVTGVPYAMISGGQVYACRENIEIAHENNIGEIEADLSEEHGK